MIRTKKPFTLGIVEGFFGSSWSWQTRHCYAEFLSQHQFNAFLYAPKSDEFLRKSWQHAFPEQHKNELFKLSQHYLKKGINFGIGLSPFELYRNFDNKQKVFLKNKLQEIEELQPSTLCILFDDMRGDFSNLAEQQIGIMEYVLEQTNIQHIIMCPTYYSDDPALRTYFGEEPKHYLTDLGKGLASQIDIFWTGPKVLSPHYPTAHLQALEEKLLRKVTIWDNYPVNDGAKLTNFLHLKPFQSRQSNFKALVSGHYANPMNQAFLSKLALYSLSQQYQGTTLSNPELFEKACLELCEPGLAQSIINDIDLLQEIGLDGFDKKIKVTLLKKYEQHRSDPMANEILDWLNGQYVFDPDCLT